MFKTKNRIDSFVLVIILFMLSYSAVLLTNAWLNGAHLGEWIWNRHQNQFSWYSRPLFIIPACYFAYKQQLGFVIAMMALLGTSLFWFAPPTEVSETISQYLAWERQMFFDPENRIPIIILSISVLLFLFLLFYAFWQKSFWIGLLVLNIGNLLKIGVSILFGGETGMASIVPTLSSMVIINIIAFIIWKMKKSKSSS